MRTLILTTLALSLLSTSAAAQLQGPLSGTLGPGSFTVVGNISVEENSSLIIEPGTDLLFTGGFCFEISGYLYAVGTETDSIRFMPDRPGGTWSGLDFDYADNACTLGYCLITGSNSNGILLNHSGPSISRCTISGNSAPNFGGGMLVGYFGCGGTISNCVISNNSASSGGGIRVCSGNTLVIDCIITGNTAQSAGGINVDQANPTFFNCVISGNSASGAGGGMFIYKASPRFKNCTITGNSAGSGGGGLFMSKSSPDIFNCTISGNSTGGDGGAIWLDMGSPEIVNTIVEGNSGNYGIDFGVSPSAMVIYSDFSNNENGNFTGLGPPGLGEIVAVNTNGDSCDAYNNIFLNPDWVLPEQDDYRLQWGSPCIDAGDPNPQFADPDSTVADMGVFFYDQSAPARVLLTPHNMPIQISPGGGSFDYTIWLTNIDPANPQIQILIDVTLPDGTVFGPLFGPVTAQLDSGYTDSRERTQVVPAGAPEGLYTYNAYAFVGTDTSFDSFAFFKHESDASDWTFGWTNTGEPFDLGFTESSSEMPSEFRLFSAYPNPFNPTTTISFTLPEAEFVTLSIFDVSGRMVTTLVDGWRDPGMHEVTFEASTLTSGI